jgi:hypothetical protein
MGVEMANKLIFYPPAEGQLTLGVIFHMVREKAIREATGFEPIGYVVDDEDDDDNDPSGKDNG